MTSKLISLSLHSSIRGFYATPTAPLPFLSGVVVRSFVLERKQGNIIIYNSPGIMAASHDIVAMGRLDRLLVNHWHEAMQDAPTLPNLPIYIHEKDKSKTKLPVTNTFSDSFNIDDDLEVIPTPGHTKGATMFLWNNGEHRLLFSGDTIWVQGGRWKVVLLGESDRKSYLASLSLLMSLDFDYLVPWGSEDGQPYAYKSTRAQAQENLKDIYNRLEAGENA